MNCHAAHLHRRPLGIRQAHSSPCIRERVSGSATREEALDPEGPPANKANLHVASVSFLKGLEFELWTHRILQSLQRGRL